MMQDYVATRWTVLRTAKQRCHFCAIRSGSKLFMRRKDCGKFHNGLVCRFFHPVFQVWLSVADLKERFLPACITGSLISVKSIPILHDTTGFGDVAQLGGKIEKPGLVFDDVLVETFHPNFVGHGARLMFFCTSIKTDFSFQEATVRSSRN